MYTAKILNKGEIDGIYSVTVEFSNGKKTFNEKVKPQDKVGFEYWVKQRLASLNSIDEFEAEDSVGKVIEFLEPTDTRTRAEKDLDAWLKVYYRWINVKTNLVDTGVVPADNAKVLALLQEVKDGLKPAYIDYL